MSSTLLGRWLALKTKPANADQQEGARGGSGVRNARGALGVAWRPHGETRRRREPRSVLTKRRRTWELPRPRASRRGLGKRGRVSHGLLAWRSQAGSPGVWREECPPLLAQRGVASQGVDSTFGEEEPVGRSGCLPACPLRLLQPNGVTMPLCHVFGVPCPEPRHSLPPCPSFLPSFFLLSLEAPFFLF